MASVFKQSTRVFTTPLLKPQRESILAAPLSPDAKMLLDYPIEKWLTAPRETFNAYSPGISSSKELAELPPIDPTHPILRRVALYRGAVTELALDAIVNAANEGLLGGGGVDGAIHAAAGPLLLRECAQLSGCPTGECVLTKGYNLPARYVLHTVGPIGEHPALLHSCYRNILSLAVSNGLRSVGLCGVSTGVYGYPVRPATQIALSEVILALKEHPTAFDLICFACFHEKSAQVLLEEIERLRGTPGAL
ncbi:unnamed protein product [Phytomonas sp. EM1]|nr:unnamed protein product [Phytomonas sp. EM1]|eukprot:CCW65701.1 unnamed protein product [Phytomonas sp. isolate EM1]